MPADRPPLNFRTLDLNLLRVFDALMQEGSLTRAAERLALTQPAASHALKRLHTAVGEPLFQRTAAGMRATPRAESLWPAVRSALAALEAALAPAGFDPAQDAATFRLAMADAIGGVIAPALVAAVEGAGGPVNLRFVPLATRDPRRGLQAGDADLAVGHFPQASAAVAAEGEGSAFRQQRLSTTPYVCVMRPGHPLAAPGALTLESYCTANHLLASFSGRSHGLVDEVLAALGRRRRVLLGVNQFFTAGQVVQRSDLLTVMPVRFVAALGPGAVVVRPLPFALAPMVVTMMWNMRSDAAPAQRWLRDAVARAGADPDAPGSPASPRA